MLTLVMFSLPQHPLSLVPHQHTHSFPPPPKKSMGGLMARYAIGCLYNPATAKLCGLTPCHLITMATPHCGCDADGVAQVCVVCCGGV